MARRKDSYAPAGIWSSVFLNVPAWACIALALGACLLVQTVLPVRLRSAGPAIGGALAMLILLAAFKSRAAQWNRMRELAKDTAIDSVRTLSWPAFESLVSEAYWQQGYIVTECGGGADAAIDLKLRRNDSVSLVQCSQWRARKIGVSSIREFYRVLMEERAVHGIFITSGAFTAQSRAFARGKPLELIGGNELLDLLDPRLT